MPRVSRSFAILGVLLLVLTGMGLPGPTALAATPAIRLSPTSGYVDSTLTVSLSRFPKNATIAVAWDGKTIASTRSSSSGSGNVTFPVPVAKKGVHTVTATSGSASASARFTVDPKLRVTPSTATVGSVLSVTLRGYAKGESVSIALDTTSKVLATVTASGSGSASAKVTLPPATGGRHKVIGSGNAGSQSSVWLTVTPSVSLSPSSGPAGFDVRIALRGYSKGERIEIQWIDAGGSRSMAIVTASSTGSAGEIVTVPANAPPGTYAIRGVSMPGGVAAQAPFRVT